jgi:hypothetical protein
MLGVVSLLFAACQGNNDSPTEPVDDLVVERVTDLFAGTLTQGAISCHSIVTGVLGDLDVAITELAPLSTLAVGLGLGQPAESEESGCLISVVDTVVHQGDILRSPDVSAGTYCACVIDEGNIFPDAIVDYTLEVTYAP